MIPLVSTALLAALSGGVQPEPSFNVYYETDRAGLALTAQLRDASGPGFALLAHVDNAAQPTILGWGGLDRFGNGTTTVTFPAAAVDAFVRAGLNVRFSAAYMWGARIQTTDFDSFSIGANAGTSTSILDFDHTIGDDSVMVAGRVLAGQWADIGLGISVENNRAAGPDLPILFDSANPTGGDFDLRTPNPSGFNNTVPLGHLLIIAENAIDSNGDGLIDVPDDEAAGGSVYFDFELPATISSVTMVDIDERPGTELRFYRNGNLTTPDETLAIDSLGDGSVQTVTFLERDVDRFEVFFRGSGGISDLAIETCPTILNFDETSTGVPRGLPAGTWVTNQYSDLGATVVAQNNVAGHPDKAILFDTLNPTGGDFDLRTPNPGAPGNTEPLGMVLIIAENDIDANNDGLVDDPDDEAGGGQIRITWDHDVTFLSTKVLDVDGNEIDYLRLYDVNGTQLFQRLIPDAPDGAVQRVEAMVSGVRTLELDLGGSGALSRVRFCPDRAPR